MRFRRRVILVLALVTAIGLTGSFGGVLLYFVSVQQSALDRELLALGTLEAQDVATNGFKFSSRPGPRANDVGPLPKHVVVYDSLGKIINSMEFDGDPPSYESVKGFRRFFNAHHEEVDLRCIVLPVPGHPGFTLFYGAPRDDIDSDAALLFRSMVITLILALVWAVLVTAVMIKRLTLGHQAIADVARLVADGDLTARVGGKFKDPEIAQLASDIDNMIERLGALLMSQRRFIANAAHELRSPLATLYGELQFAQRKPRTVEEYRRSIEECLDSSRRLKALAEDLLALARATEAHDAHTEEVSIPEMIEEVVRELAPRAGESRIRIHVDATPITIQGVSRDLARMLRNLVENALRHAREDGQISIEAREEDHRVCIRITDDGDGVPETERARIFEPFFRGNAAGRYRWGGTGLGLSIAREIARNHGGDVVLEEDASDASGARFIIRLGKTYAGRRESQLDLGALTNTNRAAELKLSKPSS